jgi:hypothetical protein
MRLVLLIALAGCWTGAEPPVEEPTKPIVASDAKKPPPHRAVAGTWRGTGFQYDTQETWDIVMTLRGGVAIGRPIGTIEYPSFPCKAELILEGEKADMLVMREKMVINAGNCIDGGTIQIPRDGKSPLDWRWFFPDGAEGAKAQLRR